MSCKIDTKFLHMLFSLCTSNNSHNRVNSGFQVWDKQGSVGYSTKKQTWRRVASHQHSGRVGKIVTSLRYIWCCDIWDDYRLVLIFMMSWKEYRDDFKLLDDGGEIPKYEGKRLTVGLPTVKSPVYLTETWWWHVGLLSHKKKRKEKIKDKKKVVPNCHHKAGTHINKCDTWAHTKLVYV